MQTKLTNSEYKDVYAFGDDMRLIWNNCILYNPEGTDVRFIALQLQTRFEERFKEILAARILVILMIYLQFLRKKSDFYYIIILILQETNCSEED